MTQHGQAKFSFICEGDIRRHASLLTTFWLVQPRLGQEQTRIDECMTAWCNIRQEDTNLTIGDFAHRATILVSDTDGVGALLRKASLIKDEDTGGGTEQGSNIALQGIQEKASGPRRLGEQTLEGAWSSTINGFGDVLSVASISLLDQQTAEVLLAATLGLLASEERSEVLMKGRKRGRDSVKCGVIHRTILLVVCAYKQLSVT
jgi:hypothetical protein